MPSKPLTPAALTAYLDANPDQKAALIAYREAAKAVVLDRADRQRGIRRKPIKPADLAHWTVVLYGDFATAGPAVAGWHGFGRDQWPPLQVLRNHGIAFSDVFADLIDAALDA